MSNVTSGPRKKIAIVGGGIAGLTAAWLLHDQHDITLFEKEDRVGGNAYTHRTADGDDIDISVFAYSTSSYKNFFALLGKLGVETTPFGLSGISATSHNFETNEGYRLNPVSWRGFLPANLRRTAALGKGMMKGVELLNAGKFRGLTVEDALKQLPMLKGQIYLHFACMLCLTSSMEFGEFMSAPAEFFFGKVKHHMLTDPRDWRTVTDRTQAYINKMADKFRNRIVLNAELRKIERNGSEAVVVMEDGSKIRFDDVIFACPADTALQLLEKPTDNERRLLGAWTYKDGLVIIHRDDSHFPVESKRNLYCYLYTEHDGKIETSINACFNRQPGVDGASRYLGTQHPNFPIRDDLIELQKVFRTPIFSFDSVRTQAELPKLNGQKNTWYCGSHFGYGLHEDAVTSAIVVARAFGAKWPR